VAFKKIVQDMNQNLTEIVHQNIAPFYGIAERNNRFYILSHYDGLPLKKLLTQRKIASLKHGKINLSALSEKQISHLSYQVLQGLAYLHNKRLIHGHVVSEHVLLSKNGHVRLDYHWQPVYLPRLGIMESTMSNTEDTQEKKLSESDDTPKRKMLKSKTKIPPEVIKKEKITKKCDIWQFGVILTEMCGADQKKEKNDPFDKIYTRF